MEIKKEGNKYTLSGTSESEIFFSITVCIALELSNKLPIFSQLLSALVGWVRFLFTVLGLNNFLPIIKLLKGGF